MSNIFKGQIKATLLTAAVQGALLKGSSVVVTRDISPPDFSFLSGDRRQGHVTSAAGSFVVQTDLGLKWDQTQPISVHRQMEGRALFHLCGKTSQHDLKYTHGPLLKMAVRMFPEEFSTEKARQYRR